MDMSVQRRDGAPSLVQNAKMGFKDNNQERLPSAPVSPPHLQIPVTLPTPDSPYANLKLLSKLASPHSKGSKVSVGYPPSTSLHFAPHVSEFVAQGDDVSVRKDKSLTSLCQSLFELYGRHGPEELTLDVAASQLGVERRRIYDIVNVFEGVEVVIKKKKNTYTWFGLANIRYTLAKLKMLASSYFGDPRARPGSYFEDFPVLKLALGGDASHDMSLGILTQRFIMMFLVSKTKVISLSEAGDKLIFIHIPPSQRKKNKIRRLYDIANILTSLRLIEKVTVNEHGKKTAFRWAATDLLIPPEAAPAASAPSPVKRNRKQSLLASNERSPPAKYQCSGDEADDEHLFASPTLLCTPTSRHSAPSTSYLPPRSPSLSVQDNEALTQPPSLGDKRKRPSSPVNNAFNFNIVRSAPGGYYLNPSLPPASPVPSFRPYPQVTGDVTMNLQPPRECQVYYGDGTSDYESESASDNSEYDEEEGEEEDDDDRDLLFLSGGSHPTSSSSLKIPSLTEMDRMLAEPWLWHPPSGTGLLP